MEKKISEKILSFARKLFYDGMGGKFQTKNLKKLMDFLFVILEKLSFNFEILYNNYLKLYDELIDSEINMAKIKSTDKVLVIGSGSLPASCILILEKTKAKITGIDYDKNAIKNSLKFLKRINLDKKIEIKYGDGLKYPMSSYDIIFILYGIKPRIPILKYISKEMKNNSRVIFRTSIEDEKELLEDTKELSKYYIVKEHIYSEKIIPVGSYLLLKK